MARWRKKVIKMDEDYKSVRKEIDKTLGKTGERKTDREQEFIVKEPAVKKIADEEGPVKKEVFNKLYESAIKEIDELLVKLEEEKKEKTNQIVKNRNELYEPDIEVIE